MPAWPSTLPAPGVELTIQRQPSVIRTENDAGPANQRRRFSAMPQRYNPPVVMTGAQKQAFDTFFVTDLADGVNSFTWLDPTDDSTVTMRFRGGQYPEFTLVSGGPAAARVWRAVLDLEILP